jgi:protoporphyrinogen/coproporphyrinogen III oxidase
VEKKPSSDPGSERRTMFVTLRDGLNTMTNTIIARLEKAGSQLRLGQRVTAIRARSTQTGEPAYSLLFDAHPVVSTDSVVLATPAYVSGELIRGLSPGAADILGAIPYASTATVSLAYGRADLGPRMKGFGVVVPRVEHRDLLAATWTSQKWSHRTPLSQSLVRCYVGGVGREEIVTADDRTLTQRVRNELTEIAGIIESPIYVEVNRWERGMPQYTLGHLERLEKIQDALQAFPGLYVTGAGYRGIGIPDCIRDGTETAERVIRHLLGSRP